MATIPMLWQDAFKIDPPSADEAGAPGIEPIAGMPGPGSILPTVAGEIFYWKGSDAVTASFTKEGAHGGGSGSAMFGHAGFPDRADPDHTIDLDKAFALSSAPGGNITAVAFQKPIGAHFAGIIRDDNLFGGNVAGVGGGDVFDGTGLWDDASNGKIPGGQGGIDAADHSASGSPVNVSLATRQGVGGEPVGGAMAANFGAGNAMAATPALWKSAFAVSPFNSADQIDPDIVQLADGTIAVAWTDTAGADEILFSVYDPLGELVFQFEPGRYLEALPMSDTPTDQGEVDLVAYAGGGFGAVYEVDAPDDSDDIEYTAWNADFTSAFRFYVEADPHPDRPNFEDPIIARSSTSGHVFINFVRWNLNTEGDAVPYHHYRMYDPANGTLSGRSSDIAINYDGLDLAALANGEFVLASANSYSSLTTVFLSYFDEFGNSKSGAPVNVDTVNPVFDPDLAPLTGGDVAVAWTKRTGGDVDIRARVMDDSGNPVSGVIDVVSGAGSQHDPVAVALNDGGFAVFWDDPDALKGQRFDATGTKIGFEFVVVNTLGAVEGGNLSATTLADGRVAVTWQLEFGVNEVQMAIWDPRDEENPGTPGDDLIIGTPHSDYIPLTGGRDHVIGWTGPDIIEGNFTTGAIFDGGDGQDFARFDWIDFSGHEKGVHIIDLEQGFAKWEAVGDGGQSELLDFEHADGTYFVDVIIGTKDDNILSGLGGNDFIDGGNGADILNGGDGDDVLVGGTGGMRGDTLIGDNLDGGSGIDTADYSASDSAVIVSLSSGAGWGGHAADDSYIEIENVTGSAFNDLLYGDSGGNALAGGSGADSLIGGSGADRLSGGSGSDLASYVASNAAVIVNLASGFGYGGHAAGDTYIGIENATGSAFNDQIYGDGANNILNGFNGSDSLIGGLGSDTLIGGHGSDLANYAASNAAVIVNLASGLGYGGHAAGDTYSTVENATGSIFNDQLYGNSGANILNGFDGADSLIGGLGADTLIGGDGLDLINYSASNAGVVVNLSSGLGIFGHAAGDTFSGVENVTGSSFRDVIIGNAADNILRGGGGDDTFHFGPGGGFDTIMDFADDLDDLDFSGFGFASAAQALGFASDTGASVLFDFGGGDSLLLAGVANVSDLSNDIIV